LYRFSSLRAAMLGSILIFADAVARAIGDFGVLEMIQSLLPVLIVAATLMIEDKLRRFPSAMMRSIGNASYSIYLSHLFFLRICEMEWRHFDLFASSEVLRLVYGVLTLIFVILGGIAVHHLIERPMLLLFQQGHIPEAAKSA